MISYSFTDEEMEHISTLIEITGDEKMAFYLCIDTMYPVNPAYMESFYNAYHSQRKEKLKDRQ